MANMVIASPIAFTKYPSFSLLNYQPIMSSKSFKNETKRRIFLAPSLAYKKLNCEDVKIVELEKEENETFLYSFNPLPFMFLAALPGAGTIRSLFGPFVELVKSWNLPDWLVHWGHPGNMAVVLFAMGGYGTYLGFRIRFSNDVEEKAKAKDLHPKLLGGMFFFFALGATGGITSLLTSDKPILESPHVVTGFIGLTLLTIQTILPTLFESSCCHRFYWPYSFDYTNHFAYIIQGESWIEECSWDIGKWYNDIVSHTRVPWTST